MGDPSPHDDTSTDYEQSEIELLGQDRDAGDVSTADIDEVTARQLVSDLVDAGIAIPIAEKRVLVHEPSTEAFESITQLAVFHKGWTAASDGGEVDK